MKNLKSILEYFDDEQSKSNFNTDDVKDLVSDKNMLIKSDMNLLEKVMENVIFNVPHLRNYIIHKNEKDNSLTFKKIYEHVLSDNSALISRVAISIEIEPTDTSDGKDLNTYSYSLSYIDTVDLYEDKKNSKKTNISSNVFIHNTHKSTDEKNNGIKGLIKFMSEDMIGHIEKLIQTHKRYINDKDNSNINVERNIRLN